MKFTKNEIKAINDYGGHGFDPDNLIPGKDVRGREVKYIIVVSHGRKELHDSGYPYIKIIGVTKDAFLNLGYHDHFVSYVPTNTDSLGKNVFRVMPWDGKIPWVISDTFWSSSSFVIGTRERYSDYDPTKVVLR